MKPWRWLFGPPIIESAPRLLVREGLARTRERVRRLQWWAWVLAAVLLGPWLIVAFFTYLELVWATAEWLHGSRVYNWLAPKV